MRDWKSELPISDQDARFECTRRLPGYAPSGNLSRAAYVAGGRDIVKRSVVALHLCLLTAGIASSTHAAVQQPDAFDSAIENGDFKAAAQAIEKVAAGAPKGKRPSLDAYYGRFFAAAGQSIIAEPYLVRAVATEKAGSERDKLSLELARTREAAGLVAKAEADYRRLSQRADVDLEAKRDATLALARLRMGAAPNEAIDLLTPLTAGGQSFSAPWEAHLLLSRAQAILGRPEESKAALASAWLEAPSAPSPADAIALTAMDMAVDRASRGDRAGEVGLVSLGSNASRFNGLSQVPVCNDAIRPEDQVTVAIVGDAKRGPLYSVVRASRPGIAQFFTQPLAAAAQQIDGAPLYVTLRCRSEPAANVRFAEGSFRNLPVWMAEKGMYPPLRSFDPDAGDPMAQLKAQVQELERSGGADAPVLAPVLLQLAFMQGAQSRFSNSGNFADAKATADRAIRILATAGAPAEVLEQLRVQMTFVFAQNQNIADATGPAALQTLDAMTARPDTTPEQAFTAFGEMSGWQLRPTDRIALSDRLLSFFDARKVPAAGAIRQAVEISRAGASREIGTITGLKDRLASHGIAPDLCSSADRTPSIPPTAITLTSDDYPKDLLRQNVVGQNVIELSIAEDGKVAKERMIVSQPSGLFDAVTAEKLKAVVLLPAQRDGKPVACRGMVQSIRWQIPYQGDFANPFAGYPFPPSDVN